MKKNTCVVCGKNTLIESGCHLNFGLDFCTVSCLVKYTEILYNDVLKMLEAHDIRIKKLEKKREEK
jgi:hypothetical protein